MWKLEHPEYLFALLLPAALWLGFALAQRAKRRTLERIGRPELLMAMMQGYSAGRERTRMWLLTGAMILLVAALCNPQIGIEDETVTRRSLDVVVVLDISMSMLAEDVPPNRLEQARQFARELVSALRSERMGLVLLAGNAYPQVPLTSDFAAMDMALRTVHPGMAPSPGTAIGEAINAGEKLFAADSRAGKAIILISDGETHDEEAVARMRTVAKNGVLLFTAGAGTPQGGFIPVEVAGRSDYKRDERGEPVRTRLEEGLLRELARTGKGQYFRLQRGSNEQAVQSIRARIDTLEKQEMEQQRFERYRSFFQVFLAAGLLMLAAAYQKFSTSPARRLLRLISSK